MNKKDEKEGTLKRARGSESPSEENIRQRSKLIARIPIHRNEEEREMEEIKAMIGNLAQQMKEDMKRNNEELMKSWTTQLQNELREVKEKLKENGEQLTIQQEEWEKEKRDWRKTREDLEGRLLKMEKSYERQEREKRRNKIIMMGVKMNAEREEKLKQEVQSFLNEKIVETKIKSAHKLAEKTYLVELEDREEKSKVMRSKSKLKGTEIYINDDYTPRERKIQLELKEVAKREREKGNAVKVGYKRITINSKMYVWEEGEGLKPTPKN